MPSPQTTAKAIQLVARRRNSNSAWYYIARNWRRQLVYIIAYTAVVVCLFYREMPFLASSFACFVAGTKLRDLRWWLALSREWPTTSELLDWPKIEAIAHGTTDLPPAGHDMGRPPD